MRNIILGIFAIGVLAAAGYFGLQSGEEDEIDSPDIAVNDSADSDSPVVEPDPSPEPDIIADEEKEPAEEKKSILDIFTPDETKKHLIPSAFTPQAPTGNWENPYGEACEEVSLLIARSAITGDLDAFSDPVETERLILDLVERQKDMLDGIWIDTDAALTKRIGEELLGLEIEIIENPTIEIIESELLKNHPIIIPAAGKELKNPFFSGEGPDYHMNVIVGFDRDDFIVQEPGTRRGEGYKYNKNLIMSAINDWDQAADVLSGEKRVLVVKGISE